MVLAIGVLVFMVLLFALLAVAPLLPQVDPAESTYLEGRTQLPLVSFPTDRAKKAA